MERSKPRQEANPYLNARREWDERYGDQIARARSWRYAAIGALAVAGIAVLGVAYIGSQSKIKPYVVALDRIGNPVAMAQPVAGSAVDQRIIEAQVANWVWEWRSFLPEQAAQKQLSEKVYAMISNNVAAELDPWYSRHWKEDAGKTVQAAVTSVLPISKNTFQVNWQETTYQNGQSQGTSYWKANITVGLDAKLAQNPQVLINNPLGIYVKDLTWTQIAQGGRS